MSTTTTEMKLQLSNLSFPTMISVFPTKPPHCYSSLKKKNLKNTSPENKSPWCFSPVGGRLRAQWETRLAIHQGHPAHGNRLSKHEKLSHKWDYSHDVDLSSSCGTGLQAFCAADASLDAPASRGQPGQRRGCAPVQEMRKGKSTEEDVYIIILWVCL